MHTVLFWMVALEIGAVAACVTAVAKLEIRRHCSRRLTSVALNSVSSAPLATAMELRFPGQKKIRGYDYPELCSKDMSERLLKMHRILTRDLQMH